MSRPPRHSPPIQHRERLRQDFSRAAALRQIHPELAEVRIELEFHDETSVPPSPQAFSYFPAARGFFRFACPCHSCSGEFDLSEHVAELARRSGALQRVRRLRVSCPGERLQEASTRAACPISVGVRVSAVVRSAEPSS